LSTGIAARIAPHSDRFSCTGERSSPVFAFDEGCV
jgi:hypothetical protein